MEWRSVAGYEGLYEVSNTGLVKGLKSNKVLKPIVLKNGYLQVNLCKNNEPKKFLVHRLVATAFIPNPKNKPTVEHIDGKKTNNHIDNLCWATKSEQEQTRPCKGYCWDKSRDKWIAKIKIPGKEKVKNLGRFEKEEDASAAYLAAKYIHHPFWVEQQRKLGNIPPKKKVIFKKKN